MELAKYALTKKMFSKHLADPFTIYVIDTGKRDLWIVSDDLPQNHLAGSINVLDRELVPVCFYRKFIPVIFNYVINAYRAKRDAKPDYFTLEFH